eukprot:gene61784-biopygen27848
MTNMPPKGGSLWVTPSTGYEVETHFIFTAMRWVDKDLPLGYQFTYATAQSSQLGIGDRSPYRNSTTSLLPAGSATARYSLNCSVRVYDAYGAATRATTSVTVRPVSSQAAQAFVVSAINNSASSGISLSVINLLGTLLGKVNCSGSPNCAALYRSPCSSVDHTCGPCFTGYAGESGSRNSPCVNLKSFSARNSSIESQRRLCLYNCSGHGLCTYVNSNSGQRTDSCDVLSSSCDAICMCSEGYSGSACSVTKAELEQKQKIRGVLLDSLLNLTKHSSSAEAVTALVSSLSAQTANPDEISATSASSVLGIVNSLLSGARQFKVDQQDISSQLLPSIDAVATAWDPTAQQSPDRILDTLQNMVFFSSSQMHPSQDSVSNVLSNFKTSVNTLTSITIAVPLSPLEELAGERSSGVDLSDLSLDDFSVMQSTRVSLVQLKVSFFSKNSSFKSNPLVITHSFPQSQHRNLSTRFVTVTLVNNGPNYAGNSSVNFSTICHRRQYLFRGSSSRRFVCPSSGYVIVHNCTNKVGLLTTACPRYQPSCSSFVDVHHPSCTLLTFTANLTVCNCSLSRESSSTHRSRRLDSSSGDIVVATTVQLVATGRYLVEQVGETLSASPSLASPDALEHVFIVISMFASLWVIGFALIAVGWRARGEKSKVHGEGEPVIQRDTAPLSIRQDLTAYIEEVIPSIFRGESNTWQRFREVFLHHKYTALVYTSNLNLLNVTRIVTVQSMLMFILAVTYDLQSPSDDGSCLQWQTEDLCTQRKSYLDSSQSYCQWEVTSTDDMGSSFSGYTCSYHEPSITPQEVLSIIVIVSVLTALFLRPMEFFFKILSAPISNRIKVSTAKRTDRRKSAEDSSFAEILKNHQISKIAGIQVRGIPEATIATRSIARKSLRGLSSQDAVPLDSLANTISFHITDNTFSKDVLKTNLSMEINRQRRLLSGMELDEFDSQWGILRHSETILA